jgi:hypothetical protein
MMAHSKTVKETSSEKGMQEDFAVLTFGDVLAQICCKSYRSSDHLLTRLISTLSQCFDPEVEAEVAETLVYDSEEHKTFATSAATSSDGLDEKSVNSVSGGATVGELGEIVSNGSESIPGSRSGCRAGSIDMGGRRISLQALLSRQDASSPRHTKRRKSKDWRASDGGGSDNDVDSHTLTPQRKSGAAVEKFQPKQLLVLEKLADNFASDAEQEVSVVTHFALATIL